MTCDLAHRPVLLEETLNLLAVRPGGTYIDGTFGRGGHSRAILKALGPQGRLLAIDRDPDAIEAGREMERADPRLILEHAEFSRMATLARDHGLEGKVDGILLDLGVSSPQLDAPERGFSFLQDGPLDMRMNPASAAPSAARWLASAEEGEIAGVLKAYGEERFAKRIARAIVQARLQQPIERTLQLAQIVAAANPAWEKHKHPATRSFQAIRIFLNRELDEVAAGLQQGLDLLAVGGRLVVISFHSLEDRLVKRFFKVAAKGDDLPRGVPVTADTFQPRMRLLKGVKRAGAAELEINPRARSAMLRGAEKLR